MRNGVMRNRERGISRGIAWGMLCRTPRGMSQVTVLGIIRERLRECFGERPGECLGFGPRILCAIAWIMLWKRPMEWFGECLWEYLLRVNNYPCSFLNQPNIKYVSLQTIEKFLGCLRSVFRTDWNIESGDFMRW